jgi:L-malate glycosyltransferase
MRILFVSHTGSWSGAEVVMMRLIERLRAHHEVAIACPTRSRTAELARERDVPHYPLPRVDVSLRLDPVWTTIGLSQLAAGGIALRHAVRRFDPDVLHANTLRAGLVGAAACGRGRPPMVVQTHEHLTDSWLGRTVRRVIAARATSVVAVCDHTAQNFNHGLPSSVAERVYISIDGQRFSPSRVAPAPIREQLGLRDGVALLGEVAQITPWKRQDLSIRALDELHRRGIDAHLLLVGDVAFTGRGVRYDNRAYLRALHRLVESLRLRDRVHFLGWRDDVPALLGALDLSLLPSQHEPFGTSVAESMAMGTPALVSSDGGPSEYIVDRVSGRVLPPGQPEPWAGAAYELLSDPSLLTQMSQDAKQAVTRFNDETYTSEMLRVYDRTAGSRAPAGGRRAMSWNLR